MAFNLNFTVTYYYFFLIYVIVLLCGFGVFNIIYAYKSRSKPEKKDHPEFFKNEVLVGVMFFFLAIIYPFLFDNAVDDPYIKKNMYFHLWDSFFVHVIVWLIVVPIWMWNNRRKNRIMTFEAWKVKALTYYKSKSDRMQDISRKLMHALTAFIFIALYYLGFALEPVLQSFGWPPLLFATFFQVAVGFHTLFVMNIVDHMRLQKFNYLGHFARNWMEGAMKPSEYETFTSAPIMLATWIPFAMGLPCFLFSACLIGTISDALASLIGKNFGKHHPKGMKKTTEGFIAGAVSTYFIVIIVNMIQPFPGASMVLVQAMAIAAAFAFLLVDIYVTEISDNFANPAVCGLLLMAIYYIFML